MHRHTIKTWKRLAVFMTCTLSLQANLRARVVLLPEAVMVLLRSRHRGMMVEMVLQRPVLRPVEDGRRGKSVS